MIDYAEGFDCVGHNTLWKIPQEMGIPDHLTYLLRNLYAGEDQQLDMDMEQQTGSKSGKEYVKDIYCYLAYAEYFYVEYIMRNARLDEAKAGIKIAGRNINNLRYADNIHLW